MPTPSLILLGGRIDSLFNCEGGAGCVTVGPELMSSTLIDDTVVFETGFGELSEDNER